MGKIRGTHSSPGIYTKITDVQYAAKSLGITTLGLVGETKKGPAFEPVAISDWNMFKDYFGGTSTEKFKGSQMPKYELPYIAKSYLSASDQLYVCRVLGLSGYDAGPAWAIYGFSSTDTGATKEQYLVALLRSRGKHLKGAGKTSCNGDENVKYDEMSFVAKVLSMKEYKSARYTFSCESNPLKKMESKVIGESGLTVGTSDYGRFVLLANSGNNEQSIVVSLNPGEKEYIYNALGSNPSDGDFPVYVEELYDLDLAKFIEEGKIDRLYIKKIENKHFSPIYDPIRGLLSIENADLTRANLGQVFLANSTGDTGKTYCFEAESGETNVVWDKSNGDADHKALKIGGLYKVVSYKGKNLKESKYCYVPIYDENKKAIILTTEETTGNTVEVVKSLEDNVFYCLKDNKIEVAKNIGNYKEQFRHAMTPWIVSELKGDSKNIEVKRLFRFHTISDGNASNEQVKITIANVRPDEGTFDVLIRDFNDSDGNQTVLESYRGLTMVPGDAKYIGLQIGTLDGEYELKSKYVYVEVIENDMTETCVPCGFMGYPTRQIEGIKSPNFAYNTSYDEDVRVNRQTFGLSDITGVDVDMLYYKGVDAYNDNFVSGYTNGFHLDSTLSYGEKFKWSGDDYRQSIRVDGMEVSDWSTVSINAVTEEGLSPIIGSEADMEGTIYEDVKVRKFTVYPYGGFDGWDIYRESRTNGDDFRANKYKGAIAHGEGVAFSNVSDGNGLGLTGKAITSDYYAYLAGYRQFADPEAYVINLFATPGIDYVNQKLLVNDVFEIIHERQDSMYLVTTPDKPYGASDSVDEMYSPADAAANLEDSSIDSYYGATYYPWVKYYDTTDSKFISLPVTKDVLRNMANIDNKRYPWFAPAGIERGDVECTRARIRTKLEDEDTIYDGLINPVKTFSADGVKIWGNKTMYSQDTPMNRINAVRMVLYLRKLINEASRVLIFDQNDETLKAEWEKILKTILNDIKSDRGITDYRLSVSQTAEQMDAHEMSCRLFVKPTPTLEYLEIEFVVTPQGVEFEE